MLKIYYFYDIIDLRIIEEGETINYKVPDWCQYMKWYDLNTIMGLYDFIQEMESDGINIDDYDEIKVYYDIIFKNAMTDTPNMINVEYSMKKLKNALIRYGFAHTTWFVNWRVHYYWYKKGD